MEFVYLQINAFVRENCGAENNVKFQFVLLFVEIMEHVNLNIHVRVIHYGPQQQHLVIHHFVIRDVMHTENV